MSDGLSIEWSGSRALTVSDFGAEPNPAAYEDSHSVIKYRFTWTVGSESVGGNLVFFIEDIRIVADFYPLLSWMRPTGDPGPLLHHEQGCFDLAELVKEEGIQRIRESLYPGRFATRGQNQEQRKQFAKEDSGRMIAAEVARLQEEYDRRCSEYRQKTGFGLDADAQSKYDAAFAGLRP